MRTIQIATVSCLLSALYPIGGVAETDGRAEPSDATNESEVILELTVINLGDGDGPVQIAIDTEKTWFVKDAEPAYTYTVPRDGEQATLRVEDLEPGVYALRVYHDEDDDGELGTNFLGIPKEPYGFSGEKTNRLRPRSFDYARFTLDDSMEMTIRLR